MAARKKCPECGARLSRCQERDGKAVVCYECENGHFVSVDKSRGELVSVTIPFKHLKVCSKCGRKNLKVESERAFDSEEGISKLVVYRCPVGHASRKRQLVVRQFNMPPWEGEDY